jgi:hypothetical protein
MTHDGRTDGSDPTNEESASVNRRTYLKASFAAAAIGTPALTGRATATTRYGISFDRIVNAVDDLGWDPTGTQDITVPTDRGLLIEVPPGEYVFEGTGTEEALISGTLVRWGLRGLGDDPSDVVFRTSNGQSTNFIVSGWSSRDVLVENFTLDNTMSSTGGDIGNGLRVQDGLEVHNIDHIGFTGRNPDGRWSIVPTILSEDGAGVIENYRKTGPSLFVGSGDSRGAGGVFHNHRGTVTFRGCHIANQGGSGGLYTGKHPGDIVFENCHFENNDMAGVRTSAGVELRNCTVVVDWDNAHPENVIDEPIGTSGVYLASGPYTKSGGGIYGCDLRLKSTYTPGLAGIVVNPSEGAIDIHDTTIQMDVDGMPAVWVMDPEEPRFSNDGTPETPWGADIETLVISGTGDMDGRGTIRLDGRDGTTIRNSCLRVDSAADGIVVRDAANCSVSDTNIVVGGRATDFEGSTVSTSGLTANATCPHAPDAPDDGAGEDAPTTGFAASAPTDGNLIFNSVGELQAVARQAEAGNEPWVSARTQVLNAAERAVDATPVGYTFDDGREKAEAARDNIRNTALAYAFTDEERFAEAAVEHLHAFLVDPATRYSPTEGSMENGYGGKERIINSLVVPGILFGASVVKNHPHWEEFGGEQQVQDWCRTYLQTCREYSLQRWGDEDRLYKYSSNRFTYRMSDRMANASYLRDDDEWDDIMRIWDNIHNARYRFDTGANLIVDENGAPNGRSRSSGWEYALFDLDALVACAEIAHHNGVDLYNYQDAPAEADIQFDGHKGTRDGPLLHRTFEWFNNVFYNPDEFVGRLDEGVVPPNVGATGRGLTAYEYASSRYDGTLGEEIRAVRDRFMPRPTPNRKYTGFPTLTHADLHTLDTERTGGSEGGDTGSGDGSTDRPTDTSDAREIRLQGVGSTATYRIETTEGIWGTEPKEASPDGALSVTSTIGGYGSDPFLFRGEIAAFEFLDGTADVFLDQQQVDPETLAEGEGTTDPSTLPNLIVFDGTGDNGQASYSFTIDGEVVKSRSVGTINDSDVIDGQTVTGTVNGGVDAFRFSGDLTQFDVDGTVVVRFELP